MTEPKKSKRSRRAERREQKAAQDGPDRADAQQSVDEAAGSDEPQAADASERPRRASETIRDRNLRLREKAAAERRAKRERQQRVAPVRNLDAGEIVDDALARATHTATVWLKRNFNVVQWVVVVLVAGGIGWQIYTWRTAKTTAKHSDALAEALDAETGVVGQSDDEDDPFAAIVDRFSDDAARLQRASEAYRKAYSSKPTSGIGLSAKLGLAGVLFEQSKYDEAMKAYREVLGSALGKQDPSVHGRALEGIGLCLESKGDDAGAAREFGRLANSDVAEFRVLGLYHQARMALKQGDKAKAKDLLTQARDKLTKSPNITGPSYLDQALKELALAVDPAGAGSGLSGAQLQALSSQIGSDPARLQKLMDDIRKNTLAESQQPAVPEQAPEDVEQDTEAEPTAPGNAKPQAPPEPPPANSQPTQEKSPASQETAP